MFSWKVLWSTALIFTWTLCLAVKSLASASNCLAKVVPLSLVPQVTVPLGLPPPPPPVPPPLLPLSPPPHAARLAAADSPRAPRKRLRLLRAVARTEGGISEARYSASVRGRGMRSPSSAVSRRGATGSNTNRQDVTHTLNLMVRQCQGVRQSRNGP